MVYAKLPLQRKQLKFDEFYTVREIMMNFFDQIQ